MKFKLFKIIESQKNITKNSIDPFCLKYQKASSFRGKLRVILKLKTNPKYPVCDWAFPPIDAPPFAFYAKVLGCFTKSGFMCNTYS